MAFGKMTGGQPVVHEWEWAGGPRQDSGLPEAASASCGHSAIYTSAEKAEKRRGAVGGRS